MQAVRKHNASSPRTVGVLFVASAGWEARQNAKTPEVLASRQACDAPVPTLRVYMSSHVCLIA